MKILVPGRRTNTLQDIRAAVAAADKTQRKPEGTSKPARVTIADMKAGIVRAVQASMGAANTNILMRRLVNRTAH